MKQVDNINKDKLDKESFQVHYGVHSPGKAKKSLPCKRRSGLFPEVGSKLHRKTFNVGRARDPGMANKENEVTCADVRGNHYKDNCGPPVSTAEASKMAGASSKYSDFTELSKDHEAMTHILFGRNLRLKVALTLWRRNSNELVAYLIRIEDTGVLLDLLPVITDDLQTEAPCFSLGCCVDLIPQVKVILASKYEEHILVGLHWVQSVIKKWWPELSKTEKRLRDSLDNRNIEVLKQRLKDMWKDGARLCLVPGSTGDLAKDIEAYVLQLR
ncbi:KATNB1-like protein 1 [Dunckerocampus dactyliophorus]|uniref:KATNB1-like protein 1 n=1 Tax=Dunckerocampus dactyliophorus TaxID=161453 RepID=UPI00240685BC|nr:KATNB1-like protein 1 [Dunckerocampus dactyliophorus]XP_054617631.1 KATNB1-like protein 1 [Dunckerocampus dactyliophorus]XP_054617632.1 KATNB1-like protein 1 [Dunckerocampus dactyliophorus]